MLVRLLPILLIAAVAALEVEDSPDQDQAPLEVADDRPRGERADGELPPQRRPRPRPGGSGFGSFLSGLLGSVTKTASVDSCPGKCIHALASLICDEVLEEVECPTNNMRCCVERSDGMPPPPRENDSGLGGLNLGLDMPPRPKDDKSTSENKSDDEGDDENDESADQEVETTTKKKKQKKRRKNKKTSTTTTTTTTTTTEPTTTTEKKKKTKGTTKKPKTTTEADDDEDYSGDYENSDTKNSNNTSRLQQPIILILASVLTFLQTLKY